MQTAATSVVSAAVIGGDLILGLGDGSIINCGRVQGPQGLKGDPGPMGATGRAGIDGNTIHTVEGAPDTTLGKDGDFAINVVVWEIYGPRAGGVWGTGTPLRGDKRGGNRESKDPIFGMGSGEDGSGGGKAYNTANLPLAGTGRAITAPGGNIIPIGNNLVFQSNLNRWVVDSLTALDTALPVSVGDVLPDDGEYEGDLFLKDGLLYIYTKGEWLVVGGESDPPVYVGENEPPGTPQTGELWYCTAETELTLYIYTGTVWVPAAPPVSLDGIEASIANVDAELLKVNANIAMNKRELDEAVLDVREDQERQDHQILELEEEIEALAPTFDRGEWAFVTEQPAAGQYAIGHLATSEYCLDIVGKCLIEAGDDEVAKSQCTRIAADCEAAEEKGEAYLSDSWGAVDTLKIHKLDAKGKEHGFGDWSVGKYVELFNHDDEGYGLFQIDKEAVIEADVATFKVHHVAHQGKPAGVARAKVFEMAAGDPTDYVRKSGDDMTGALYIRPPKNSTGLRIYAPQGDAGAGQADATQLVRVANSHNQYVFYVEESGAIAGKDGMLPTQNRHLVSKKYVDELIAAELTAPARFEWKVYVNADGTPQQGSANLNGASMSDTSVIRLHKRAQNAPVPIKGHGSGLTMYKYSPSPKFYHSTILSAWSNTGTEWQWKGTAEIDQIKLFSDYIQITLSSHKWSNMNFSNTGSYRFTIGGLF